MPTTATTSWEPTGLTPYIDPDDAHESQLPVAIVASVTLAAGTIIGEVTATPGTYKAYASANSDGSQNPAGILQYPVTTDASGKITNVLDYASLLTTPMFTKGTFRCSDLVGLDANAVTKLSGLLLEGSVTTGIFRF